MLTKQVTEVVDSEFGPSETDAKDVKELEAAYRLKGPAGLAQVLHEQLDRWKAVSLHVAVIGSSGVGKSSYINCARNLTAEDEGSAAVGVVETTAKITSYSHPDNDRITYWDVPGVNTRTYPQNTYLEKIRFDSYDFFLLLSCSRFTEDDMWLANQIRDAGKKFYYVRTKTEYDLDNYYKSHPKTGKNKTAHDILHLIRTDAIMNLGPETDVFLIDNFAPDKFDFSKLQLALLDGLPDLQRETFLYSLNPVATLSKKILREKIAKLHKRIWKISSATALIALIPLPGSSVAGHLAFILKERNFYMKELGLDAENLKLTADIHAMDVETLRNAVATLLPEILAKEGGMIVFEEVVSTTSQELLHFVPVIGQLLGAPLSFYITNSGLKKLLAKMEAASSKVIDLCVDSVRQKVLDGHGKK